MTNVKYFPLSDNSLVINFGNEISPKLNDLAINLSDYFEKNPFEGLIETIPAYCSLTVCYDVRKIRKNYPNSNTAFETVRNITENALKNLENLPITKSCLIEIPVNFDAESALDLDFVITRNNLTKTRFIEIFTSRNYRVFMLGFLPGFAYMGEIDEKINAPRKETPRTKVPKGSVGIAGRQTGIYPFESPGGWQIIGKTDVELFTPNERSPTLFKAGDLIKFVEAK